MLMQAGISKRDVFMGYVCQYRPANGDVDSLSLQSEQVREGLEQLRQDLLTFQPNVCLLVGSLALRAAGVSVAIGSYRGTVFECRETTSPFFGFKCIAAYSPEYIVRGNNRDSVVLLVDIKRAKEESLSQTTHVVQQNFLLHPTFSDLMQRFDEIEETKCEIAFDIEGGVGSGISCCSISTDPSSAFIIPFFYGQKMYWSAEEEGQIWVRLSRILKNPQIPKVLQNSLYDNFVLAWTSNIVICNVRDDTMLKHWELFPEMEKGLGFQTSFYTKNPYYKNERQAKSAEEFHTYCCKDSAITLEISRKQEALLQARPASAGEHYRFNIKLLPTMLYMELKGIRYDAGKARSKIAELSKKIEELQAKIDAAAGHSLNTSSSKQMIQFLRDNGFEVPKNRKTGKPTANYEAILRLAKKTKLPVLTDILTMRQLRTRVQMLNIRADDDGRVRCGYNLVGTETGRLTCYTSPTGSGYNLQTIPEYDRDLFLADEGKYFFQCDLSGADGWTVAAWCAKLGDPTMLEDLKAGIKIAKIIAAMTKHGPELASFDRELLKAYANEIKKDDPLYFASKCVQHGSNYGMGKVLMSSTIFVQSEGTVNLPAAMCEKMQEMYFKRYPGVKRWQHFIRTRLEHSGKLECASGHIRTFGGNRNEISTYQAALAHEPQANTTYATNQAALALSEDPENRDSSGAFIIEPLHQVHDALCGQFPIEATDWAVRKIRRYFSNPITIAGTPIVIPFEGAYGRSWGELTAGKI